MRIKLLSPRVMRKVYVQQYLQYCEAKWVRFTPTDIHDIYELYNVVPILSNMPYYATLIKTETFTCVTSCCYFIAIKTDD